MNFIQKLILLVGVLVFLGMCLYPPWLSVMDNGQRKNEKPVGYAPVSDPPKPQYNNSYNSVRIDKERLAIQLIACGISTIAFVAVFHSSKKVSN